MDASVCVVTVTYGDRSKFIKKLVASCFLEGVDEVYVLDNSSGEESAQELLSLAEADSRVHVNRSEKNLGSAGGFNKALRWARNNSECEFMWILDDDNIPSLGALKALFLAKHYLKLQNQDALVSYRTIAGKLPGEEVHKSDLWDSVNKGFVIGDKESLFAKVFRKARQRICKKTGDVNFPIVRRKRASYGGLFFKSSLLDIVGYPDESFYLYADDFEFSDRILKHGGSIFTCYYSRIVDIDSQLGSSGFFSKNQSDPKVYYSLRNHVYLDMRGKYYSVIFLYLLILMFGVFQCSSISFYFMRAKLIFSAICDGYSGRMGQRK